MSDRVDIALTNDEALVIFEFLSRVTDDGGWTIEDSAETQALCVLLGYLEKSLAPPFSPKYSSLIAAARDRLRPEGGTDASAEVVSGRLALWLSPKHIAFIANEWRKIPEDASDTVRESWAEVAFRAMSALEKAGLNYEPEFPSEEERYKRAT